MMMLSKSRFVWLLCTSALLTPAGCIASTESEEEEEETTDQIAEAIKTKNGHTYVVCNNKTAKLFRDNGTEITLPEFHFVTQIDWEKTSDGARWAYVKTRSPKDFTQKMKGWLRSSKLCHQPE
jgi:hypothetical protein